MYSFLFFLISIIRLKMRKSDECRFSIKKQKKTIDFFLLHFFVSTLSTRITLCALVSRLLRIKRDVYDNYVSHDEEKRTDDEYREELLFVF